MNNIYGACEIIFVCFFSYGFIAVLFAVFQKWTRIYLRGFFFAFSAVEKKSDGSSLLFDGVEIERRSLLFSRS